MLTRGAIPLHLQVATTLRNRILSADLPEGAPLLSEDKLSEHFGVSRIVIRQAVLSLVQEGLVIRQPGKGSFVRSKADRVGRAWSIGSINDLLAFGRATHLEVTDRREVSAPPEAAEALALVSGAKVYRLSARRHSSMGVISHQRHFMLPDIGRRIHSVDLVNDTIYATIEAHAAIYFNEISQISNAVRADVEIAHSLEIEQGEPVLQVERVQHCVERGAVQYSVTHYRPDRYQHMVRLRRPFISELKEAGLGNQTISETTK
jgi:GntR family transcriptional regulator